MALFCNFCNDSNSPMLNIDRMDEQYSDGQQAETSDDKCKVMRGGNFFVGGESLKPKMKDETTTERDGQQAETSDDKWKVVQGGMYE